MEHQQIVVVDGQITVTGIMAVLNAAGVRASRRSVHYFISNGQYPVRSIGKVLLVPQRACADFITDWRSRHSD